MAIQQKPAKMSQFLEGEGPSAPRASTSRRPSGGGCSIPYPEARLQHSNPLQVNELRLGSAQHRGHPRHGANPGGWPEDSESHGFPARPAYRLPSEGMVTWIRVQT